MRQQQREPARAPEALGPELPFSSDEVRLIETLESGLGGLQTARPGFQDSLEARLLDRLAEPVQPWWRRLAPSASTHRADVIRMPRRSFLAVAAASALALAGSSLALPLIGTPEVSAGEIMEKVQANQENPMLGGVKSFHLTARIWNNDGPPIKEKSQQSGPREMTTEQWYLAPDKMRTETRSQDSNGKTVVSGMMANGSDFKHYASEGAADVFMFAAVAAPIGAKPANVVQVEREDREFRPGTSTGPETRVEGGAPTAGVRVAPPPEAGGQKGAFTIAVATKRTENGEDVEGKDEVFVYGQNCPEPKRTGEATVAGRPAFVIEHDFAGCMPANAPHKLARRHVRWVDQKTYLPLKMEMYGQDGALIDRYEVTSIEYDVEIPAKSFTDLPAGTKVQEPKMIQISPANGRPESETKASGR
jgi:outer membrane lipoprotein-sorting protein